MSQSRLRRIDELVRVVAGMPTGERSTFLENVCPDDPRLPAEVERRLTEAADRSTSGPTEAQSPPGGQAAAAAPRLGAQIGPYVLKRKLGEGGMGLVFEAEQHVPMRRRVAVKVVRPGMDSRQVLARFDSERQALALMNHPHIAKVLDAGTTEDGRPYFAMEFVDGVPLSEHCDIHRLSTRDRLQLFLQVCAGVQHAHQKGILHRDLKPSNVLVTFEEGNAVVKIIDFGIAKALDTRLTAMTLATETGVAIGTPEYMSPEQAAGAIDDVDTRTDVYALGVVLYELLSGSLPFPAGELRRAGLHEMLRRIREDDPPAPSERLRSAVADTATVADRRRSDPGTLIRSVRGDLDWITMKALEKARERRYPSVSELLADVERFLRDEPVGAGPPSAAYRARKFVRRHRLGVAVATALVVSLLAGVVGTTIGLARALRAERLVRLEAETAQQVSDFLVGLFEISDPGESRGRSITALEVLERGKSSIESGLADRPALKGRLLETMGRVYRGLGLLSAAQPLLEQAIVDSRQAHGERSREVATSLTTLGGLLIVRGDADGALPLLEEAWSIERATLGPDDLERARTLNNLSAVWRLKKEPDKARPYLEEALTIRERMLGPDHPDVAKQLVNLGSVERVTGHLDESRRYYERALAIRRRTLGNDHPDVAMTLSNLGTLERDAGRFDEARRALEEAIAIQEQVLGPEHPHLASSLASLGLAQLGQNEPGDAAVTLRRAIAIAEEKLAPGHPAWDEATKALAEALRRLGDEVGAQGLEARRDAVLGAQGGRS
jgi:non-specific serine/threonine protein kinase/serine/threonine-protein kinase